MQIVPYNPKTHHPIPADVLPNDSEALFVTFEFIDFLETGSFYCQIHRFMDLALLKFMGSYFSLLFIEKINKK